MTRTDSKMQIALIASNVLQAIGITQADTYVSMESKMSLAHDDIEFAVKVAEKLFDLALENE